MTCKFQPCYAIEFNKISRPPLLKIPEGANITMYDYTENRTVPFTFKTPAALDVDPPPIRLHNPEADEPVRGSLSDAAPRKAMEKARKALKFQNYEPQRAFPVLPKLHSLSSLDDARRCQRLGTPSASFLSLELSGIAFDKSTAKGLAAALGAMPQLEYLVIQRCGLKKVMWAHAKLRYIDYRENALGADIIKPLNQSPLCEVLLVAGSTWHATKTACHFSLRHRSVQQRQKVQCCCHLCTAAPRQVGQRGCRCAAAPQSVLESGHQLPTQESRGGALGFACLRVRRRARAQRVEAGSAHVAACARRGYGRAGLCVPRAAQRQQVWSNFTSARCSACAT